MSKLWSVGLDFNVAADTQREAFQKLADYLSKVAPGIQYEAVLEPKPLGRLTREEVETCVE